MSELQARHCITLAYRSWGAFALQQDLRKSPAWTCFHLFATIRA